MIQHRQYIKIVQGLSHLLCCSQKCLGWLCIWMPAFTTWWDLEGPWPRPAPPTVPPAGSLCTSFVVPGPCGAVEGRGRGGCYLCHCSGQCTHGPPSLALPMLPDTFFHLPLWPQQVTKPGSSNELDGWGIPVGSRNYQQPKLKVSSGGGRFCSSIFYLSTRKYLKMDCSAWFGASQVEWYSLPHCPMSLCFLPVTWCCRRPGALGLHTHALALLPVCCARTAASEFFSLSPPLDSLLIFYPSFKEYLICCHLWWRDSWCLQPGYVLSFELPSI